MTHTEPAPEIRALQRSLAAQRRHVLGAVQGLSEEALHRAVLPSGWNCLGLVRHLALDVERFWFRAVASADAELIAHLADAPDDAWQVGSETPAAEVLARYRAECAGADAVIAATPPDAPLGWWPEHLFGPAHLHTFRDLVLHVVTETATHAGHLDAARELIDGKRWLVLTE